VTGAARPRRHEGSRAPLLLVPVLLVAALLAGPSTAAAAPAAAWPIMPTDPTPLMGAECGPASTATPPVGQPPRAVNLGWYPNYPVAAVEGTRSYVALGDSYAAGEGAPFTVDDRCGDPRPNYVVGTAVAGNHCHRSLSAYPYQLWALMEARDPSWRLDQRACSGARTTHFSEAQTDFFHLPGGGRDHQGPGNPPQLGDPVAADLVTITMSGNDLGFGGIVRDCLISIYVSRWAPRCSPDRDPEVAAEFAGLRERYDAALRRITSPRVVLAGYPLPFPTDARMPDACGFGAGATLRAANMRWLNSVAVTANRELRDIAAAHGATYVEVGDLLQTGDHTMCEDTAGPGPGKRWINRFIPSAMEESAHPNAYLHRAEAERIDACLRYTETLAGTRPESCVLPFT
jgi:hypothetical protein